MTTINDRLEQLEETVRTHDVMLNLLISIGERQQTLLEHHGEILEHHGETLERHGEMLERHGEMLERHGEMLAEIRRDARQTQRLWVRLAQKYGWLEDDDLLNDEGE